MSEQLSFDDLRALGFDRKPLTVEVIRSAKRKKSSQARLKGSLLEIRIPSWISTEQEYEIVNHFVGKFERSRSSDDIDLTQRSSRLAADLGLPVPESIRWVTNQAHRWGSCTPSDRTIRISDRLAGYPSWVLDYVIVHELAHLLEPNHGASFWALVNRYSRAERARGFLIAKGYDNDD